MRVLLDTNILAELVKPNAHPAVHAALAPIPTADLYMNMSVLTIGEIAKGIALLDPGPKWERLTSWLAGIERHYAERILPLDSATARLWGEMTAQAQRRGIVLPATDGLLAATALQHGLHIMTRNAKHFEASGAPILNPWADES